MIALMHRMEFFSPSISKDYGLRDFKKELKVFLEAAGVQNKPCVLYIEDY